MTPLALDTETSLFRPGRKAPELVCVSHQEQGQPPGLMHWSQARDRVVAWLGTPTRVLVGHNMAYDMAVIGAQWPDLVPLIFHCYEKDRVTDTLLRAKLLDIAAGTYRGRLGDGNVWIRYSYDLDSLSRRHLGRVLEKDEWRMRYGELRDTPLKEWPEGAREYPKEDALATLDLFQTQDRHGEYLQDQYRQARAAWWLHLASTWGLITDPQRVDGLAQETSKAYQDLKRTMQAQGLVKGDGVRDTKRAAARMEEVCEREGLPLRRTPAGGICLDADACEATEDPVLQGYAQLGVLKAVLSKDVPAIRAGEVYPIHTSFGLAASGRSTSSGPNLQNFRTLPGIRECFVPRPGCVYVSADYSGLELHTLAEVCRRLFGKSRLQEALAEGRDPHLEIAAEILGLPYAQALAEKNTDRVQNGRQTGKVANFGFPGGLGPKKMVLFARKTYGVELTEDQARELKDRWYARWPEMEQFFGYIQDLYQAGDGQVTLEQVGSGRTRGGATYTAACNTLFQGLGGDATKDVGFWIAKACYVEKASPLFQSRIVNYVHDEFILETPEAKAPAAALELSRVMVEKIKPWLPVTQPQAVPLVARFWSKGAFPLQDSEGVLRPWNGEKKA